MRLEAHGIALDLPHGWDGRVWSREGGGPVLHAANVALPATDGDFATGATAHLPAAGVVVVLVDYGSELAGTPLYAAAPTRVDPGEFSPATLLHRRPGQRGLQRFFTAAGRAMCLYVVVGSAAHAADLALAVSQVLASLRVAPPTGR
jgi:hypothetical protein